MSTEAGEKSGQSAIEDELTRSHADKSRRSIFTDVTGDNLSLGSLEDVTEEPSRSMVVKGISPRKLLRRLSAADEVDRELADLSLDSTRDGDTTSSQDISLEKRQTKQLPRSTKCVVPPTIVFPVHSMPAPPPYAGMTQPTPVSETSPLPSERRQPTASSASLHPNHQQALISGPQEDMNRFVSSSTTSGVSGTTAGSFVKHAGPPLLQQMRTIGPQELQGVLQERVGDMVFSKSQGKWVRDGEEEGVGEEQSEDPFGDIESLREEGHSVIEDETEGDILSGSAERSDELDSILDSPPSSSAELPAIPDVTIRYDEDTLQYTTDDEGRSGPISPPAAVLPAPRSMEELTAEIANMSLQMSDESHRMPPISTPSSLRRQTVPTRSAMKSTPYRGSQSTPFAFGSGTPANASQLRRSVSFSDGRRAGKIRGLGTPGEVGEDTEESSVVASSGDERHLASGEPPVLSARTKRIHNLLDGLEESGEFQLLFNDPI